MSRVVLTAVCLAPLALACNGLEPAEREVWEPDFTEAAVTVAPDVLEAPAESCEGLTRWRYTYDDVGNRVEAARYRDGAAIAERVETRTFDDEGRILSAHADWTGGFVTVTLARDPDGRIVERTVESSERSHRSHAVVVERTAEFEIVRHTGPVLLLEPFHPMTDRTTPVDDRDDIATALVDDMAMIEALVRHLDAGQPLDPLFDPFEVVETRGFDDQGRVVQVTWDLTDDGVPEQGYTVTYREEDGALRVRTVHDYDFDGAPDMATTEVWRDGLRVELITDDGADDRAEGRQLWTFDGEGRPVEELVYDFTVELERPVQRTTWQRTVELTLIEVDDDGDGVVDHVTEWHTRPDGQRVLKREDDKADGDVDWQKRYVYDADGRKVHDERDRNVDGVVDHRWDYGYDAEGRLIHEIATEPGAPICSGLAL